MELTNNDNNLDWLAPIAAGLGTLLVAALAFLNGKGTAPSLPSSTSSSTSTYTQPSSTPVKKAGCGCGAKK